MRAKRYEFTKKTKNLALQRSGGTCESTGLVYGHPAGIRCTVSLSSGVEFDHYPLQATVPGSNGLDNCVATCPGCHLFKTRTFDIPGQALVKRLQARAAGVKKPGSIRSRGFRKKQQKYSNARGKMVDIL